MRVVALWMCALVGCVENGEPPPHCACHYYEVQAFDPATVSCQTVTLREYTCTHDPAAAQCFSLPRRLCSSRCDFTDEASCVAAGCNFSRVRDAYYRGAADSFLGCYESPFTTPDVPCSSLSAPECTGTTRCTALVSGGLFVECIDANQAAGSCTGTVTCSDAPPQCPMDRTPGIAAGCYTGSCIPNELCI